MVLSGLPQQPVPDGMSARNEWKRPTPLPMSNNNSSHLYWPIYVGDFEHARLLALDAADKSKGPLGCDQKPNSRTEPH